MLEVKIAKDEKKCVVKAGGTVKEITIEFMFLVDQIIDGLGEDSDHAKVFVKTLGLYLCEKATGVPIKELLDDLAKNATEGESGDSDDGVDDFLNSFKLKGED